MSKKKLRKPLLIFSLLWTVVLFSVVTYAWIARSWTPQLEYNNISIGTTGALVITFDQDDAVYTEVNVNEFEGKSEFSLKQVTSVDGKDFISVDFNPILEGGVPVYADTADSKYLEIDFWLKTQYENDDSLVGKTRGIYLDPDSKLEYVGEEADSENVDLAIRISIEIEGVGTYLLCKAREEGQQEYYLYAAPATIVNSSEKINVFTDYDVNPNNPTLDTQFLELAKFVDMNYYDGSDNDRFLFTMLTGDAKKLTVRIWLEGCDEYCVNAIADKALDLLLKFNSKEITSVQSGE